jgi:anaerobic magnesium-protoporphyrin IX monomethyl ester cyclase
MNVVLIRPSNPSGSAYLTKFGFLPVPLGLLDLAGSILTLEDSKVKIIDMEADKKRSVEDTVEEAMKFKPEIVGLTIHATAAHSTSVSIASRIKELQPEIILVAGGHHATFVPHELLRSGFDVVVLGEGDEAILDIVKAVNDRKEFRDIPGILFNAEKDGKVEIVETRHRELIQDLDRLPFPAFDLVDRKSYTFKTFGGDSVAAIETSRGCPYACDFCSVTPTWGNVWRNKSNERILKELEIVRRLGYKWVFFVDDIFVVRSNVNRRMDLFDTMIDRGYNSLRWIVQMRADVTAANPTLIKKGAEAGMRIAFMGVESGSPEILKKLHKGILTSQSIRAVQTLDQNGIVILLGMMLGAPYETLTDMLTTIKFSYRLIDAGADAVQFSIYTPLPGTRIFKDSLENRKLFTLDWSRYDILTPVVDTKVNPAIIQILQMYGNHSFYILKWLKQKVGGDSRKAVNEVKRELVNRAQTFLYEKLPYYFADTIAFPSQILLTIRTLLKERKKIDLSEEKIRELISYSSKIVYLEKDGRNPYFLTKG